MVVADARQFPWIAEEFAAVMDPLTERLARYLNHLTGMGILDCRNPMLAAHQFMGLLNEFSLWPWMMGRESVPVPDEDVVEETVRMFLRSYRRPRPKGPCDGHEIIAETADCLPSIDIFPLRELSARHARRAQVSLASRLPIGSIVLSMASCIACNLRLAP